MKKIKDCSDKEIYDEAYKNNNNSETKLSADNCKFCTLATVRSCGIKCENDMSIIDYDGV